MNKFAFEKFIETRMYDIYLGIIRFTSKTGFRFEKPGMKSATPRRWCRRC